MKAVAASGVLAERFVAGFAVKYAAEHEDSVTLLYYTQ